MGCRRARIPRLPGRVHRRSLRPLASGDPRGDRRGDRRRHQPERAEPARSSPGQAADRAIRVSGARAVHEFRHRGESAGHRCGKTLHRARQDHGVQGRVPRGSPDLRRGQLPGERAPQLRHRQVQRSGRRVAAGPRTRGRSRRDPGRTDAGRRRLHRRERRIPARTSHARDRYRRAADLRRGDDLAPVTRRAPGEAGRHPGHHDAGKIHRRRHVLRSVRRARGDHGPVRPAQSRASGPRRHVQQQRALDGGGHRRDSAPYSPPTSRSHSTSAATRCASGSTRLASRRVRNSSSPASGR